MAAAIGLRGDSDTTALRAPAKRTKDGPQARWLLAFAAIYDGATRGEMAKICGVTLQIVRDWVLRFNTLGPEGLVDRKAAGAAAASERVAARRFGARRTARRRRSTASCLGAASTFANGCSKSSASARLRRR